MSIRMLPRQRREQIANAAYRTAEEQGLLNWKIKDVAKEAQCSKSLVLAYYDKEELFEKIMEKAIYKENLDMIAIMIAIKHPFTVLCSDELKKRALSFQIK